jgi:hypothetical protein
MARTQSSPIALRSRSWTPPAYHTLYRRRGDGTVWSVEGVFRVDRQVRLEREGQKPIFPFAEQLVRDYEVVV